MSWTKLFSTIVTSSVWQADDATRLVWITMLATKNANGIVEASIVGLAHIARVSLEDCQRAIKILENPDPYSRTDAYEGRRIKKVPGGWKILNHVLYREKGRSVERREYLRQKQAERRARQKQKCQPVSTNVNRDQPISDTDTDKDKHNRSNSCVSDEVHSDNGELFDRFWGEYPRKVGKKKCQQIWKRLKPSAELTERIITAVKAYKRTDQWLKDNGQFIPHPATWLNQERWADDISANPEPKRGDPDWLPTEAEAEQILRESGCIK